MTKLDRARFEEICRDAARVGEGGFDRDGIGRLGEKRLHRVLKRFFSQEDSAYEVPVGRFVADVVTGNTVVEIQTGGLYPLRDKLRYYLEKTPFEVCLVIPVIARRRLVRIAPETGEVLHTRLSPKKGKRSDILGELFWISDHLKNPRLRIVLIGISLDEYRYSDRLERGRREGRYERECFPRELLFLERYTDVSDYLTLLDGFSVPFSAKEFEKFTGLHGRKSSRALRFLQEVSLIRSEMGEGRAYRYFYASVSQKASCPKNP